jgi:hypothetical protein
MPNPLPERTQRLVVIGLITALAGFGIYFSLGGFSGDQEGQPTGPPREPGTAQGEAEPPSNPVGLATVPPSPIPTTETEDLDVLGWFPFTEAEFQTAGATAQAFAEAYGTIDYSESPEAYYSSMEALATDEYAEVLSDANRAGAFWEEMSEAEAVAQGRAEVQRIRTFGSDSITFVVTAQSITETGNAEFDEDLGDFAVTVIREHGSWAVFDFQPASAGQFGEE